MLMFGKTPRRTRPRATERWSVLLLTWAISTLILAVPEASAHDPSNYWAAEWQSQHRGTTDQDYEFTNQVPGDANGWFADRVAEGGQEWNNISINGPDMRYRRNGVVPNYDPFAECIDVGVFRNGIHYRNTPNDSIARTRVCTVFLGNFYVRSFQIVFDPDHTPFYTGPDGGNIEPGDNDVGSIATHEFGHASSGWTNGSLLGHYSNDRNAALCPQPPTTAWHTMCTPTLPGKVWRRTLEQHDKDVFIDAYG